MQSSQVRSSFLSYFERLGHRVVPSSSLIPAGDPTLFFNNAGMNQFKDVFTGQAERDYVRAASAQKCMRVSGKHNDFETVGRSLTHHTFFEMLGNFSFGDYFKSEAIAFAWRLVTQEWGVDGSRLVATVFEDDDEAEAIWRNEIGLGPDRVLRLGASENYWSMGDTGPNGPCSELHVDFGPDIGCRRPECAPDCDCERFLEIWNLVFMQFDRDAAGNLTRLPEPSIDTGMGLERISAVLQGVVSNYDGDLFAPILEVLSSRSGVPYRPVERGAEREAAGDEHQVSMRVVADHVRAVTFLLADGVFPSNEGRGYVLRKILRRAASHAAGLGLNAPILSDLTQVVVRAMSSVYPELAREADRVRATCEREERAFEATLSIGLAALENLLAELPESGEGRRLEGEQAFRLHDTFGFPIEYTVERAREAGVAVDRQGFERALEEQRARSRAAAGPALAAPTLPADLELPRTRFLGHDELRREGCLVQAIVRDGGPVEALGEGERAWLVLDRTPFYAESGGQVGDRGQLEGREGTIAEVEDCQALRPGVHGHRVVVRSGVLTTGDRVTAEVDAARRRRVMANHTATHLLHRALKDVLGAHVTQAGSLVAPDRLRFDFTHHEALSPEQVAAVEDAVNDRIHAHLPVQRAVMDREEAIGRGAVAMFGEKYEDRVRVISVGDWSVELCGGTHCRTTEQVGGLRVVSERGVASGVRRIEAVTGPALVERLREDEALLEELGRVLKAPRAELVGALEKLSDQVRDLRREVTEAERRAALGGTETQARVDRVGGVAIETRIVPGLDVKALRDVADQGAGPAAGSALLLASEREGKAALVLKLGDELVRRLGGSPARELITELATEVGGGGGGRADMAWAGGRRADRLQAAVERLPGLLEARLGQGAVP